MPLSAASRLKKFTAVFLLVAYISVNYFQMPARAKDSAFSSSKINLKALQIPADLGTVEEFHAEGKQSPVILIQDAHAIPEAQRSIQNLIFHLQKKYGISRIGLEGASQMLDTRFFRSFPDQNLLKKTFEDYHNLGELSGPAAASLFNGLPALYQGIEDWALYEEGTGLYLKASAAKMDFSREQEALQLRKKAAYSKELFEIDEMLEAFHAGNKDLGEILRALAKYQKPEGRTLQILFEEWDREKNKGIRSADQVEREKRLKEIRGPVFFKEFEAYAKAVKGSLFKNEAQRALDRESKTLALAGKLARLELSRDEWEEIKKAQDFPRRADLKNHFEFYENSEKRDAAFLGNLQRMRGEIVVAGGFHAGALARKFREKGIPYALIMPKIGSLPEHSFYQEQMRGEVSWKKYFRDEKGQLNLYDAFARAARDKLLKANPDLLKPWRDQLIRDLAEEGKIENAEDYTRFLDEVAQERAGKLRDQWKANIDQFLAGLDRLSASGKLNSQNIAQLFHPATSVAMTANLPFQRGSRIDLKRVPLMTRYGRSLDKPGTPLGRDSLRSAARADLSFRSEARAEKDSEKSGAFDQDALLQGLAALGPSAMRVLSFPEYSRFTLLMHQANLLSRTIERLNSIMPQTRDILREISTSSGQDLDAAPFEAIMRAQVVEYTGVLAQLLNWREIIDKRMALRTRVLQGRTDPEEMAVVFSSRLMQLQDKTAAFYKALDFITGKREETAVMEVQEFQDLQNLYALYEFSVALSAAVDMALVVANDSFTLSLLPADILKELKAALLLQGFVYHSSFTLKAWDETFIFQKIQKLIARIGTDYRFSETLNLGELRDYFQDRHANFFAEVTGRSNEISELEARFISEGRPEARGQADALKQLAILNKRILKLRGRLREEMQKSRVAMSQIQRILPGRRMPSLGKRIENKRLTAGGILTSTSPDLEFLIAQLRAIEGRVDGQAKQTHYFPEEIWLKAAIMAENLDDGTATVKQFSRTYVGDRINLALLDYSVRPANLLDPERFGEAARLVREYIALLFALEDEIPAEDLTAVRRLALFISKQNDYNVQILDRTQGFYFGKEGWGAWIKDTFVPTDEQGVIFTREWTVNLFRIRWPMQKQEVHRALKAVARGDEQPRIYFSPGGERLVVLSEAEASLWDIDKEKKLADFPGNGAQATTAVFSPDGKYVAMAYADGYVRIWNNSTGEKIEEREIFKGEIRALAFSGNPKDLLIGGEDGFRVLTLGGAIRNDVAFQSLGDVTAVASSPDGKWNVAGNTEGEIWLWDATADAAKRIFARIAPNGDWQLPVSAIQFSPEGDRFASAEGDEINVWDLNGDLLTYMEVYTTDNSGQRRFSRPETIQTMSFSPDGTMIGVQLRDSAIKYFSLFRPSVRSEARSQFAGNPPSEGGGEAEAIEPERLEPFSSWENFYRFSEAVRRKSARVLTVKDSLTFFNLLVRIFTLTIQLVTFIPRKQALLTKLAELTGEEVPSDLSISPAQNLRAQLAPLLREAEDWMQEIERRRALREKVLKGSEAPEEIDVIAAYQIMNFKKLIAPYQRAVEFLKARRDWTVAEEQWELNFLNALSTVYQFDQALGGLMDLIEVLAHDRSAEESETLASLSAVAQFVTGQIRFYSDEQIGRELPLRLAELGRKFSRGMTAGTDPVSIGVLNDYFMGFYGNSPNVEYMTRLKSFLELGSKFIAKSEARSATAFESPEFQRIEQTLRSLRGQLFTMLTGRANRSMLPFWPLAERIGTKTVAVSRFLVKDADTNRPYLVSQLRAIQEESGSSSVIREQAGIMADQLDDPDYSVKTHSRAFVADRINLALIYFSLRRDNVSNVGRNRQIAALLRKYIEALFKLPSEISDEDLRSVQQADAVVVKINAPYFAWADNTAALNFGEKIQVGFLNHNSSVISRQFQNRWELLIYDVGGPDQPRKGLENISRERPRPYVLLSPTGDHVLIADRHSTSLWGVEIPEREHWLTQHQTELISAAVFSRDGQRVAVGNSNGVVQVWDVATGQRLAEIKSGDKKITSLVFSADGSRIISGNADGEINSDAIANRRVLFFNPPEYRAITALAISPDGKELLSASNGSSITVWDVATQTRIERSLNHGSDQDETPLHILKFSPEGNRFASVRGARVYLWDAELRRPLFKFDAPGQVENLDFSPDGTRLGIQIHDGGVLFFDLFSDRSESRQVLEDLPVWLGAGGVALTAFLFFFFLRRNVSKARRISPAPSAAPEKKMEILDISSRAIPIEEPLAGMFSKLEALTRAFAEQPSANRFGELSDHIYQIAAYGWEDQAPVLIANTLDGARVNQAAEQGRFRQKFVLWASVDENGEVEILKKPQAVRDFVPLSVILKNIEANPKKFPDGMKSFMKQYGRAPHYQVSDAKYLELLKIKAQEEALGEIKTAPDYQARIGKLADLLEVMMRIRELSEQASRGEVRARRYENGVVVGEDHLPEPAQTSQADRDAIPEVNDRSLAEERLRQELPELTRAEARQAPDKRIQLLERYPLLAEAAGKKIPAELVEATVLFLLNLDGAGTEKWTISFPERNETLLLRGQFAVAIQQYSDWPTFAHISPKRFRFSLMPVNLNKAVTWKKYFDSFSSLGLTVKPFMNEVLISLSLDGFIEQIRRDGKDAFTEEIALTLRPGAEQRSEARLLELAKETESYVFEGGKQDLAAALYRSLAQLSARMSKETADLGGVTPEYAAKIRGLQERIRLMQQELEREFGKGEAGASLAVALNESGEVQLPLRVSSGELAKALGRFSGILKNVTFVALFPVPENLRQIGISTRRIVPGQKIAAEGAVSLIGKATVSNPDVWQMDVDASGEKLDALSVDLLLYLMILVGTFVNYGSKGKLIKGELLKKSGDPVAQLLKLYPGLNALISHDDIQVRMNGRTPVFIFAAKALQQKWAKAALEAAA